MLYGCQKSSDDEGVTLRIGFIPDRYSQNIKPVYQAFSDYLEKEIGLKTSFVESPSYEDLVDKFISNDVDLAYLGALSFMTAHLMAGAEPLVSREIDTNFISYFIVNNTISAQNLTDLKGHSFAFGDKLSTSGHLMPHYYLEKIGIYPETFFSKIIYSKNHENTVELVRDGTVDVGAVNYEIFNRMIEEKKVSLDQVYVIAQTNLYQANVWATSKHLPKSLKAKILEAFLSLSYDTPEHRALLDLFGTKVFLPVSIEDFSETNLVMHQFNLAHDNDK